VLNEKNVDLPVPENDVQLGNKSLFIKCIEKFELKELYQLQRKKQN